jgi:CspA family cold shock protein
LVRFPESQRDMAVGRVKWFNDAKGYGFIERDPAAPSPRSLASKKAEEIFVHFSAIQGDGHRTLEEGQEVEFDIYEDAKGKTAQNVMPRV